MAGAAKKWLKSFLHFFFSLQTKSLNLRVRISYMFAILFCFIALHVDYECGRKFFLTLPFLRFYFEPAEQKKMFNLKKNYGGAFEIFLESNQKTYTVENSEIFRSNFLFVFIFPSGSEKYRFYGFFFPVTLF